MVIVLGTAERSKVEVVKQELSAQTQQAYDSATTYHDGKWLLLTIDNEAVVVDVIRILALKRKPKE